MGRVLLQAALYPLILSIRLAFPLQTTHRRCHSCSLAIIKALFTDMEMLLQPPPLNPVCIFHHSHQQSPIHSHLTQLVAQQLRLQQLLIRTLLTSLAMCHQQGFLFRGICHSNHSHHTDTVCHSPLPHQASMERPCRMGTLLLTRKCRLRFTT